MLFGAHMSIAGGFDKAVNRAVLAGCDSLQIFTKNSSQWKARPIQTADAERFGECLGQSRVETVVAHDSYLINLASPDDELWQKSIAAFQEELERCELLGVPFLVTHPGAYVKSTEAEGIQRVSEALNRIHQNLDGYRVSALLETTAGQGTTLGRSFEQLAAILQGVRQPERVGFCFDTCHVFAAGYDIRSMEGYQETMEAFESALGLDKLKAFHLNDSKKGLGTRVDRHDHIGAGEIGLEGFRHLVNDARFKDRPGMLETPKSDDLHEDIENLATLRGLIAAES